MSTTKQKAATFRELHIPGNPLVLCNVWDAGSAKTVAAAGAKAVATSSWSVAAASGYADGERLPLDELLVNLRNIVRSVALPVSVDIEAGYGVNPHEVRRTVERTLEAGAIGCNLEDSAPASGAMRPAADQAARIREARKAADSAGNPYFINARTDVFFSKPPAEHDAAMVETALERARAYADAGADGIFVPGLVDKALISRFTRAAPLPVNIMILDGSLSAKRLGELGVARVSQGPSPYLSLMKLLGELTRTALAE